MSVQLLRIITAGEARRQRVSAARAGITLLELMLVLALLVMIGAMAYPSLQKPFQMQTLRKGAELVRIEWSKARNKAMRTGQIQMFSFVPQTGNYLVQPYYTEQDVLEGNFAATADALSLSSATAADSYSQAEGAEQGERLPEGVVFADVQVESDMRSLQLQQTTQNVLGGSGSMTGGASPGVDTQLPPILFYPDGTTSDARVVLTNQYQSSFVVVSVRGLTGIVKVSELVSADAIHTVP